MVPDLLILRSWMDDRKSALVPLFIAKPTEFPASRAALSHPLFSPWRERVRLKFKKTVSDFNQVVIEPRFVLYSKYRMRMRANTLASTLENHDTVRIFPPTYFTIRVFSTLRLHFHSGGRNGGVNNRRRQARVDRSIVGRVLYIYIYIFANNLGGYSLQFFLFCKMKSIPYARGITKQFQFVAERNKMIR